MKTLNVASVVFGNVIIFLALYYAVFILGNSGWWFAFLLVFNFSYKDDEN